MTNPEDPTTMLARAVSLTTEAMRLAQEARPLLATQAASNSHAQAHSAQRALELLDRVQLVLERSDFPLDGAKALAYNARQQEALSLGTARLGKPTP